MASAVGFWTTSTAPASSASSACLPSSGAAVRIKIGTGARAICSRTKLDAIHARHQQIARDHIRFELLDGVEGFDPIPGRPHDFDIRTAREHLPDRLPDETAGVIDDQHSDESSHVFGLGKWCKLRPAGHKNERAAQFLQFKIGRQL